MAYVDKKNFFVFRIPEDAFFSKIPLKGCATITHSTLKPCLNFPSDCALLSVMRVI